MPAFRACGRKAAALASSRPPAHHPVRRPVTVGTLACLAVLSAGVVMLMALRAQTLPEVSGRFAVGGMELGLAPGTAAIEREGAATPRVHVWYPLTPDTIAPEAPRRFPVLLYFPGWPGSAADNLILVRELASHGYVVAAAEYPAIPADGARAPEPFLDFSSAQGFQDSVRRNDQRVRARAHDAVAILDALTVRGGSKRDILSPSPHLGVLPGAGILGFSLGGAVAAEACRLDRRFAAAVNLDGLHFAAAAQQGVEQPYLLISDDSPLPTPAELDAADPGLRYLSALIKADYEQTVANLERHGGTFATLAGTRHVNFSDGASRWRFRRLTEAGSIDPARAHEIIQAYVLAFFAKYLQGEDSPLLAGNSTRYPEMHLRIWTRAAGRAVPAEPATAPPRQAREARPT